MATLQNIRNRSGLLLAVIGIAMLAFIMGDLMKSTNSGSNNNSVGKVFGNDIVVQAFEQKVNEGIENWKIQNQQTVLNQTIIAQIRDQIWDQYVRDLIMENEYEKLGIDVSDDEFFELLQGLNVHPEISKIPSFQDPITGLFDRTRVLGYLKQIDQDATGESLDRWVGFQKYLIGLIKISKYNALVGKSMYTTNHEANLYLNSNNSITFDYVSIPFTSINDTLVAYSDDELETYYEDCKHEYEQEASRDVDFVVYTVVPSLEDDAKTKSEITDLVSDFEIYEDDAWAKRTSDNTAANFVYTPHDAFLEDPNWGDLFNSKKGTVIGPYLTRPGVYRISKLAEQQYRPDSVQARHILIKPSETISLDSANRRIEALKIAIEEGANFEELAKSNSDDQGSAIKGGDLGWFKEGVMVDEFNEACFTSKKLELSIVSSQFGVHLVQVTKIGKSVIKSKIAYIDRNVEPSTETFISYYTQAAYFAGEILNEGINFDTLVTKNNLIKRSDTKVTVNKQNISGLPNSREMIRWMNDAEIGSVSEVFEFDNSYVVAYVTNTYSEGFAPLKDIKEQIKSLVIKEKKALLISNKITNSDLDAIAKNNDIKVVPGQKALYAGLSIQGIGYEPELVGAIFANKLGSVSNPIIGRNAVYIIEVTAVEDEKSKEDLSQEKLSIQTQLISYSNSASYNALNEAADVVDNRADFY